MEEPIKEEVIGEEIIMEDSVEEEIIEETDELEKTFDLSNMLSELPVGMLDEIPTKDMLEELPIGEETKKENGLIMSTDLLDSLQKENTNDLLDIINTDFENVKYTDLITNIQEMPKKEIILEEETLINEQLPDLISNEEPLLPDTSLEEELLEELPEVAPKEDLFEELPKEEVKEELLVEEPKKEDTNNLEDLSNLADNILATDTLTSFEPKKEELESKVEIQSIDASSQLLANLTNGFTMDFLDEPVMQKVKTR